MYSIGQFSKITSLTVKTLRYYHEISLLVPIKVDPDSGYRYYSENQISIANTISKFKDMRFDLEKIKSVVSDLDNNENIQEKIESQIIQISQELEILNSIKTELESSQKLISNYEEVLISENISEKELPSQNIVSTRFKGKYTDVGRYFQKLYRTYNKDINGKPITLYHDNGYKESDADLEVCVPIKKQIKDSKILSGGKFLSYFHKGPYKDLSITYKFLIDHINTQKIDFDLPLREIYHKGPGLLFRGNSNNYVTEILVKIS